MASDGGDEGVCKNCHRVEDYVECVLCDKGIFRVIGGKKYVEIYQLIQWLFCPFSSSFFPCVMRLCRSFWNSCFGCRFIRLPKLRLYVFQLDKQVYLLILEFETLWERVWGITVQKKSKKSRDETLSNEFVWWLHPPRCVCLIRWTSACGAEAIIRSTKSGTGNLMSDHFDTG